MWVDLQSSRGSRRFRVIKWLSVTLHNHEGCSGESQRLDGAEVVKTIAILRTPAMELIVTDEVNQASKGHSPLRKDQVPDPFQTSHGMLARLGADSRSPEWSKFLKHYSPFIAGQICQYPLLKDWEDDIIQEVLIAVAQSIPHWKPGMPGGFRCWLRSTTRHRILEALRKSQRFPMTVAQIQSLESELAQWEDPASRASQQWDDEHDQYLLSRAMGRVRRRVDPKTWAIFEELQFKEKLPAQVAMAMGISVGSVYSITARVMRLLREEVADLQGLTSAAD